MFAVTSIYAGLLGLLFIALSTAVVTVRRSAQVSLGDAGNAQLQRRIRAQGNCAEYAPLGLLLIALAEAQGAPAMAIHALGICLLLGRLLHARAFLAPKMNLNLRIAGMVLTFTSITFAALGLLLHALF